MFKLPTPSTRIAFPSPINTLSLPRRISTQSYTLRASLLTWFVAPFSEAQSSLPLGPTPRSATVSL